MRSEWPVERQGRRVSHPRSARESLSRGAERAGEGGGKRKGLTGSKGKR